MISIIMPVYNEEKRIGPTLEAYGRYFESISKKDKQKYEILVVLNACKDGTLGIVKEYCKKYSVIKYIDLERGGKGYAVITGFEEAIKQNYDLIGFVDGDLATSPEEFYKLIQNIDSYDGIIASRYMRESVVTPKPTFGRIIVSRIFNFLVRSMLFLPYKDTQCGAKLFKRKALVRVIHKISMSQWAFDVDILYQFKKLGFKVKEFPTKWSDKKYSKINFMKAGPGMFLSILRLRIVNSVFKRFINIYDYTLKIIKWQN